MTYDMPYKSEFDLQLMTYDLSIEISWPFRKTCVICHMLQKFGSTCVIRHTLQKVITTYDICYMAQVTLMV